MATASRNPLGRAAALLVAVCTIACAPAVVVDSDVFSGDFLKNEHSGAFRTGTLTVYLPDGEWTLMGKNRYGLRDESGSFWTANLAALGKTRRNGRSEREISGLVLIDEVYMPLSEAVREMPDAQRELAGICLKWAGAPDVFGMLHAETLDSGGRAQGCWTLKVADLGSESEGNAVGVSWQASTRLAQGLNRDLKLRPGSIRVDIRQQMKDYAAANDIRVPINMLVVRYYVLTASRSARWVFLDYFFNPELEGIAQSRYRKINEADWQPSNIGRYPDKLAYVKKLIAWGQRWQSRVVDGLTEQSPP